MTGANGNGKRIDAGLGDELLNFAGICELRVVGVDVDIVFDAGQLAKLGLHHDAVRMGVFDNLARLGDVVLKAARGSIDHNGRKAAVDAGFADFEIRAMVKVQRDRDICVGDSRLDKLDKIDMLGIFARAGGNLEDNGRLQFGSRLCDSLDNFHVVDVERTNGITALICLFKHFGCCNQRHDKQLLYFEWIIDFPFLLYHFPHKRQPLLQAPKDFF